MWKIRLDFERKIRLGEDACGRLYLRVFDLDETTMNVYRLDVAPPRLEAVGELPLVITHGLAIQGTRLYTIHPTIEAILVIDLDTWNETTIPVPGIETNTTGMDFGPGGDLWITGPPPPPIAVPPGPTGVQQVDLLTATTTEHPEQFFLFQIAVSPPGGSCAGGPQAIPTLSPWALLVLAGSLALAAWWIRRRSRPATTLAGLLLAGALLLLATPAAAEPFAYTLEYPNLVRVDLATFETEPIGISYGSSSDLTFDRDGNLYGTSLEVPPKLLRFDAGHGRRPVAAHRTADHPGPLRLLLAAGSRDRRGDRLQARPHGAQPGHPAGRRALLSRCAAGDPHSLPAGPAGARGVLGPGRAVGPPRAGAVRPQSSSRKYSIVVTTRTFLTSGEN